MNNQIVGLFIGIIVIGVLFFIFIFKEDTSRKNVEMLSDANGFSVIGQDVAYFGEIKGYFVKPESTNSYPGVVMIHEWWGLNENIKDMARQLASKGYMVLAVDLHNGQVATTPDAARQLTQSLNQQVALQNLRSATQFLRNQGASKIASLGWCFGGGQSLQLAMSGESLDATVIYYGQLSSDQTKLSVIQWPVLGIFGDKDTSIPVDAVRSFENTLTTLGITNNIHMYPNVGHAFANPSGANYAPSETMDAWQKTLSFLSEHLK